MSPLPGNSGSPGAGLLGYLLLGGGAPPAGQDTTMSLGLTYFAMIQLLGAKLAYMSDWEIGLYAVSTMFNPTLTADAYTSGSQVPVFNDYAPQSLSGWSAAFLNAQNQVITTLPLITWTPVNTLASGPVAGYYILDGLGNLVGAQENPSGPVIVGASLQPFSVAPQFQEQAIA